MGDGASCPKGPWAGRADSSPCLRSVCRVPRRLPSTWGAVPPSWRCPEPLIQARLGASPLRPVGFSCGQRRLACLCHPGDRARQPGVCSMVVRTRAEEIRQGSCAAPRAPRRPRGVCYQSCMEATWCKGRAVCFPGGLQGLVEFATTSTAAFAPGLASVQKLNVTLH